MYYRIFQTQNVQVGATDIAFEKVGISLESVFTVYYGVDVLDTDLQMTTGNA